MTEGDAGGPGLEEPGFGSTGAYSPDAAAWDEMCAADGGLREHWSGFARVLHRFDGDALDDLQRNSDRLLRESGVTYNVYGDPRGEQRLWALDPVPLVLDQSEWTGIEAGLIQRAELLDRLLADLYGPQRVLREGLLPAEVLFAHGGFLRPCVDAPFPGPHRLMFYAADLARGPDGRMWVLGDRCQAPSGVGYALENRTTLTRVLPGVFRDCRVKRLSGFFRYLRQALAGLTPEPVRDPLVVVLTPGPRNETYFEHSYLSTYLGFVLAQGDDLTMRGGRVWLKTLEGLQPVDVILRRVDDHYCDPLELRPDSRLGVPGLVEAARRGQVTVVNPLGSSVLENPALLPFLPRLCNALLDQDPVLPSVATWWCGQETERDYVLDNLPRLVVKPIHRSATTGSVFGAGLSKADLALWRDRIRARPDLYVGQQPVSFSTTPALVDGGLEPRHAILRTFLVGGDDGFRVMPGGLTRVSSGPGDFLVSNQAGSISKDTWVVGREQDPHHSLWLDADPPAAIPGPDAPLPSRAADNLFWVGRYSERMEDCARLLRVILARLAEFEEFGDAVYRRALDRLLPALTHASGAYPGFVGEEAAARIAEPEPELRRFALTEEVPGTIAGTLSAMMHTAYTVRDLWSSDTWRLVEQMDGLLRRGAGIQSLGREGLRRRLDGLLSSLAGFSGLTLESMSRTPAWVFLDLGRRLERAQLLCVVGRACLVWPQEAAVDALVMESVLAANESLIDYRRRHRARMRGPQVLEQLLFEGQSPRSLVYQLAELERHVERLPGRGRRHGLTEQAGLLLEASTGVRLARTRIVAEANRNAPHREALDATLTRTGDLLRQASEALSRAYFDHLQTSAPLTPARREAGS
jgi:uncharacterized circularly permuted ATP-grasp superfamily protein/uncharacterized alpha-E superfamily protein